MKTIGIFTAAWGHESIAEAIAEKIKKNAGKKYQVKIFRREKNADVFDFAYNSIYKISPASFEAPFQIGSKLTQKDKNSRKIIESFFLKNYKKKVDDFVKRNKVDLCISTYYQLNSSIESLGIPFINVVPDPITTYPVAISEKADVNLVFDDRLIKKYKNKNMKQAGWFVREKFEKDYDKKTVRKKLKINNNLTFLITSGSEGANAVLKILPSIINCNKPTNFIISCGNNDFLYKNVIGIKKSLTALSSSKANVIPLSYTKNMHLYIQAADLVVGKAGPNTLFETIACETAFFAISHIYGLEDGNLDAIKNYKIGFVEEKTKESNRLFEELIENPQEIESFNKNILKLKKYNQQSINVLLKEMDRLLK